MNDRTMLGALLVLSLVVGSGCMSARVSIGPAMRDYKDKRIAVLDVTKPQKQGLRWTILVAGEIGTGADEQELMTQSLESSLMDIGLFQMVDRAILTESSQSSISPPLASWTRLRQLGLAVLQVLTE